MLSRTLFKEYIEELVEYNRICSKLDDISNGGITLYEISDLEAVVVALLQYTTHDKNDWVPYWLYELDYGTDYRPGCITSKDGEDILLKTADDLYDLLSSEYADNGDYDAEKN